MVYAIADDIPGCLLMRCCFVSADIQSSCATSGDGLYEGLDWLSNVISKGVWRSIPVEEKAAEPVGFFAKIFGTSQTAPSPVSTPATAETTKSEPKVEPQAPVAAVNA